MSIFLVSKKEIVNVPEEDILETIKAVESWFSKNLERETCGAGIFGHYSYDIRRANIEEDVRESAKTATTYKKNGNG